MNGILLMVEVLKRELAGEQRFAEATDDLEAMRRAVLDSVATMDRFVYAHRLGRGKYAPRFAPLAVKGLVKDVVSGVASAAKERLIEITVNVDEHAALESDRDMLRLILHNLLANTVKHSRRTGGKVTFSAEPRQGGGCIFTVTDDGPGIPPEQIAGLFTLALAPTGQKGRHGVRLGLPVSRMAGDLLEATLTAESVVGTGTTFRLEVPNRSPST
jgi:signal transduction histidine kinase